MHYIGQWLNRLILSRFCVSVFLGGEKIKLTSIGKSLIAVTSTLELEKVFPVVVNEAKNLIQADKVVASLVNERAGKFELDLETLAVRGRRDQHPESWWRNQLENIAESVARSELEVKEDDRSAGALICNSRETSLLCVPLTIKEGDFGLLSALNAHPYQFTPDEITILSILANQAAVALKNARLFRELQVKGDELRLLQELEKLAHKLLHSQEEERKRISRELHDDTAQVLTNVILRLEMSETMVPPEFSDVREALRELKEITASALERVHKMAFDLRPAMLDDLGLIPTIRWYIRNHIEKADLKVVFEVMGEEVKLPPQVEIAVLRIIQEALTNVKKHAQAKETFVRLGFKDDEVTITIKDDGKGFDPKKALSKSTKREALGLMGMQERAELLGGALNIESQSGKGTKVKVRIPFRRGLT